MKHLQLTPEDVRKGSLILVNRQYPIDHALVRQNTTLVPIEGYKDIALASCPAVLLTALIHDCGGEGQILPVSGYREVGEQQRIYVDALHTHGEAFARQFVALPNCSEHQTGLAIDVGLAAETIDFICPDFPYEGVCQAFRQRASAYGFIQRYTAEKEAVTGIAHEPWHFRYVGAPHASLMEAHGFALEEYIDFLRAYPYPDNPLSFVHPQGNGSIGFVPVTQAGRVLQVPECWVQVSGNNVDGVILTIWD